MSFLQNVIPVLQNVIPAEAGIQACSRFRGNDEKEQE